MIIIDADSGWLIMAYNKMKKRDSLDRITDTDNLII